MPPSEPNHPSPRILVDEAETLRAGRDLAERLRPGDVVALAGDLGAGKTHLCKGISAGLGAHENVTSPTFALVQEYPSGRLPLYHFDFYRIESPGELLALGWDDYLDRDGVILVEWADRFPELIPGHAQWWRLETVAPGQRRLSPIERP